MYYINIKLIPCSVDDILEPFVVMNTNLKGLDFNVAIIAFIVSSIPSYK
jgi:hypothetical protein